MSINAFYFLIRYFRKSSSSCFFARKSPVRSVTSASNFLSSSLFSIGFGNFGSSILSSSATSLLLYISASLTLYYSIRSISSGSDSSVTNPCGDIYSDFIKAVCVCCPPPELCINSLLVIFLGLTASMSYYFCLSSTSVLVCSLSFSSLILCRAPPSRSIISSFFFSTRYLSR
jgi:hypothetical protein